MTSQANQVSFECLESRTLMSAVPVISQSTTTSGLQLLINGSSGDDQILISQSGQTITVRDGHGWSSSYTGSYRKLVVHGNAGADTITLDKSVTVDAAIYGDDGNDTLTAGSGNDTVYGGTGRNRLTGGAGSDTLVSIGGSDQDRLYAGSGQDTFWTDSAGTERIFNATSSELANNVHRVGSFVSARYMRKGAWRTSVTPKQISGQDLADPTPTADATGVTYRNFATKPLFSSAGPSPDDVYQGYVGDCYFLATLSSMAKTSPSLIRQSIVDLGDGTYAVQFSAGGSKTFVRVDADLPTWSWGGLAYANFGRENSTWVAIMEKAFAFYRTGAGSYDSISGGWMGEVYADFGKSSSTIWDAKDGTSLLTEIKAELQSGRSVTFAVGDNTGGGPVYNYHAYSVDRVNVDSNGKAVSVRLRNPWGVDGKCIDGANDGYVTLTATQAAAACMAATSAAL